MGMARPDKDSPRRGGFNIAHRTLGFILTLLSGIQYLSYSNENDI